MAGKAPRQAANTPEHWALNRRTLSQEGGLAPADFEHIQVERLTISGGKLAFLTCEFMLLE